MKKLLPLAFVALVGLGTSGAFVGAFVAGESAASAQVLADAGAAGSGSETQATPAAGSGSAIAAPVDHAAQLHDPVSNPKATVDDLKGAERQGWGIFAFALLVVLCKLVGRAPSLPLVGSKLAFLGKGTAALVVGAAGAFAVTAYNALVDGGSWAAVGFAGLIALAHYLPSGKTTTT